MHRILYRTLIGSGLKQLLHAAKIQSVQAAILVQICRFPLVLYFAILQKPFLEQYYIRHSTCAIAVQIS